MKKIIFAATLVVFISIANAQTPWNIGLNDISGNINANIGTVNKKALNFYTNNTQQMVLDTNGGINFKALSGGNGIHVLFVDSLGNLLRIGSGNPSIPKPAQPCFSYGGPWFEGGNMTNANTNNTAGTCTNFDFILKANNLNSLFIKASGKVGVGTGVPLAKFEVNETSALGSNQGDNKLLTTFGGQSSQFYLKRNLWLVRNTQEFYGASLHDAISINSTNGTPGLDTRTWWDRLPYSDIQTWGDQMTTYMTLTQSRLSIGTQIGASNTATLNINTGGGTALDIFDQTNNKVNFRVKSTGQTIIGNQTGATNQAMVNINVTGGSTASNVFDIYDQFSNKVNFRIKSNGYAYAREINVLPNTLSFPDYVFEKEYNMLSILEVEKYIAQNKHLPNIPSAKIINKEGINLGEMQVKQMEKIEEAFLYIIQLKKENEELKTRLEKLEKLK